MNKNIKYQKEHSEDVEIDFLTSSFLFYYFRKNVEIVNVNNNIIRIIEHRLKKRQGISST